MTLIELFVLLRRRGWIMLLLAALAAVSAFVFSRLQTPIYESSIYLLVKPSRTDLGLTQSAKTLLRSYVAWLDTNTNAQRVINTLQIDREAEALRGDATITSDDSRFIIQIDVRNEDQRLANQIAETWATLFVDWRNTENAKVRREDWVEAEILDAPVLALDRPQTAINTAAGGILGILLGGVIIFVLEYLEAGVIRSRQDVERALGLAVMGAIPVMDSGRRKG
jgi:capsular polysaccharide biosynthesis protein